MFAVTIDHYLSQFLTEVFSNSIWWPCDVHISVITHFLLQRIEELSRSYGKWHCSPLKLAELELKCSETSHFWLLQYLRCTDVVNWHFLGGIHPDSRVGKWPSTDHERPLCPCNWSGMLGFYFCSTYKQHTFYFLFCSFVFHIYPTQCYIWMFGWGWYLYSNFCLGYFLYREQ